MEGHTKTQEHFKNRRRRSIWNRAVTGMAAVVVFCTTYALILPAITMERSPTCGIEEHAHDDGCYTPPLVLSCGAETSGETLLHTHNEFCYDADKNLICPLPELQAHTHGDSCYTVIEPQPLHVHEEGCWKEKKVLACGLEETEGHSHTDSCDGQTENLICQMEQSQGHAHAGECYDDAGTLICGQEEAPGHTHGPECYEIQTVRTCGLEEQAAHQHIDTCYETEKELICGLEEATEEQLASPPQPERVLTCEKPELILHTHGDGCYDEDGNLTCELPVVTEHTHLMTCLSYSTDPNAEKVLSCTRELHTHDKILCYIDTEADLETPAIWEATLPERKGESWAEDLLAVALSQIGYEESKVNITVTPDGDILGYTRYGQWAGQLYGPWDQAFVEFCTHYAGIPQEAFPRHEGQPAWCEQLAEENFDIYFAPEGYIPAPGDRIYLDLNVDKAYDQVGIVEELLPATETREEKLVVIEGDSEHAVRRVEYKPDAPEILGYGSIEAARQRWEEQHPDPAPEEPKTYYCGKDEHVHTEVCKDAEGNMTCALSEHTHDESCEAEPKTYYCGKDEHVHTESCKDAEGNVICQLPEHTHDEGCEAEPKTYYCGKAEHVHTESCKDAEGNVTCELPEHTHDEGCEAEPKTYYCGKDEHVHTESCKDAEGNLTCELPEHTHDESCEAEPKTYYCGKAEHVHTESCKDAEGNLTCALPEHTHDEGCEAEPKTYYCGKDEHTHTEACQDEAGLCTLEEHTHTPDCEIRNPYICGKVQHSHEDVCYDNQGALTCQIPEHSHIEACLAKDYYCGREVHVHGTSCRNEAGELICTLEEHTHTDDCVLMEQSLEARIISDIMDLSLDEATQPGITVKGLLPKGARVEAVPVEVEGMLMAYDITIYDGQNKEFQPLPGKPVQVEFFVPGITDDPDLSLSGYHIPEQEQSGEDQPAYGEPEPMDSNAGENGTFVINAPHFSIIAFSAGCSEPGCELMSKLTAEYWQANPCTGANPFGVASEYNLFLFSNMENWGEVHGNAAIGGNIEGTNQDITYKQGSAFNYAAEDTPKFEIGLVLKGAQNAKNSGDSGSEGTLKKITVENGSIVSKADQFDNFNEMTAGDHKHPVAEGELDEFFTEAQRQLQGRNVNTYNGTANLPADDPHHGEVRYLQYSDINPDLNIAGDTQTNEDGSTKEGTNFDVMLKGNNPFYNVFNLSADYFSAKQNSGTGTHQAREIYLDVPFGSYNVINIIGQGELTSFAPKLRYKNSNGVYIDQPADQSQNDQYTQTQRTMMNFQPGITSVTAETGGLFLYASILAPDVTLNVTGDIHIMGNSVFKSVKATTGNNSAFIYSPFKAGAEMSLRKRMECDDAVDAEGHLDVNNQIPGHEGDNTCNIQDQNDSIPADPDEVDPGFSANAWTGYFADITLLTYVDGRIPVEATKEGLPLTGDPIPLYGLTVGNYQITKELVYRLVEVQEGETTVEKKVTTDSSGYLWLADSHLYCDEGGNVLEDQNDPLQRVKDPVLFGHNWNNAVFEDDNGNSQSIIYVGSGQIKPFTIVNHYGLHPTKMEAVRKTWVKNIGTEDQPEYVPVAAPEGAKIEVTLVRKDTTVANSQFDTVDTSDAYPNPLELSAANNWNGLWADLDADPKWEYKVLETMGHPSYDSGVPVKDDKGIWTIQNVLKNTDPSNLTVQKVWYDNNGLPLSHDKVPTDLDATVKLYRQKGTAYEHTDPDIQRKLNYVHLYQDGTRVSSYPYFPGSDVDIIFTFYVKGNIVPNAGNEHLGRMNELKIVHNGEVVATPQIMETIYEQVSENLYYMKLQAVVHMNQLYGDLNFELAHSTEPDAYPINQETKTVNGTTGTMNVTPPIVENKETRIADAFIKWDYVNPLDDMSDSANKLPDLPADAIPINGNDTEQYGRVDLRKYDWTYTWVGLPYGLENTLTRYRYFVVEEQVTSTKDNKTKVIDSYIPSYYYSETDENYKELDPALIPGNQTVGVNSGFILVQNKPIPSGPELPDCGGGGTIPYFLGGLLTASLAAILLQRKNRRKEGKTF